MGAFQIPILVEITIFWPIFLVILFCRAILFCLTVTLPKSLPPKFQGGWFQPP